MRNPFAYRMPVCRFDVLNGIKNKPLRKRRFGLPFGAF